jgi:tetratricopeptide (TPR) repeat protein
LTTENVREVLELADYGDGRAGIAAGLLFLRGAIGAADPFEGMVRLRERSDVRWVKFLVKSVRVASELGVGAALEEARNFAEALKCYWMGAITGDEGAVLRLGSLLLVHGAEEEGMILLRALGRKGSLQANCTIADYLLRWRQDPKSAIPYLKRCANPDVNPHFSEPYLILGDIYVKRKKWSEARTYLENALEIETGPGPKATMAEKLLGTIPVRR